MANAIGSNPWILDTQAPGVNVGPSMLLRVKQFTFTGYVNDTDRCILKDMLGNVVWQTIGEDPAGTEVRSGNIGQLQHGLVVDTLDTGKVLVYIE